MVKHKKNKTKRKNNQVQLTVSEKPAEIDVTERYFKEKKVKKDKEPKKRKKQVDRGDKMRQKASKRPFKEGINRKCGGNKVNTKTQAKRPAKASREPNGWEIERLTVADPVEADWSELERENPEEIELETMTKAPTALEISQVDLEEGRREMVVPAKDLKRAPQGDFVGGIGVNPPKKSFARWLREINVKWPWLKIVLVLFLASGMVLGVEELIRGSLRQPVQIQTGVEMEGDEVVAETASGNEPKDEAAMQDPADEANDVASEPEVEKSAQAPRQVDTVGKKLVALTFDDGPSKATTGRLLDILAEKQVKATFFVLGNMAQRSPELLKRQMAEGHEIGSHTMTHRNLAKSGVGEIQAEAEQMKVLFQEQLGKKVDLVRPPYGSINDTVRAQAETPLILWTVDTEDWKNKNPETILARVKAGAFDGTVILMHDIYSTTVDAVGPVIDFLRAEGYEFLTISEMAAARGVQMEKGWSYGSFRP